MGSIADASHPVAATTAVTALPFRADHVGSLLRPDYLQVARADAQAGRIDRAVLDIIAVQRAAGLNAITDGEARRDSWHMDYIYQIGGIAKTQDKLHIHFENADGDMDFEGAALKVQQRLSLPSTIFEKAFRFLRDNVGSGVPKLTIPSPSMVHYRGGRAAVDEAVYPRMEEFYADLSRVYAQEIANLGALGCSYLQLDDTSLAYLNDPRQRSLIASQGGDPDHQHEAYIRIINDAVAARPSGMAIAVHLCRGNFRSSWAAEGSYDYVADALFNTLDVDGYFLEFDDARSGGFEPLRLLPKGHKRVVLGLVTTKTGEMEGRDTILRRIEDAARFAPLDQLCLSPQCGFASTAHGNNIAWDDQRAKLDLIVSVAAEVWGDG